MAGRSEEDDRKQIDAFMEMLPEKSRPRRNAMRLQQEIIAADRRQLESGVKYSSEEASLASVHARQDLVLLVSYVGELAENVAAIRKWVSIIGWLAIAWFLFEFALPSIKARGWL